MKRPLTLFLLLVLLFVAAHTQEVTVYTIPSPKGINWKSPRALVLSYIANTIARSRYGKDKHPIGHMLIELKDNTRYVLAGVTSVNGSGMTRNVLFRGYGLGILFTGIKGNLEETEQNLPLLQQRMQTGDMAFITYKVNQDVFNRLWQYFQEYKQNEYYRIYNGRNKPREGLGAGCSAFAISFLEVGGLCHALPPDEWGVHVVVPASLVGGTVNAPRSVPVFHLLFAGHWGKRNDETGWSLSLYEPTLLFRWITSKHEQLPPGATLQKTWLGRAPGLLIDCSNIQPPEEPIWIRN